MEQHNCSEIQVLAFAMARNGITAATAVPNRAASNARNKAMDSVVYGLELRLS